MDYDDKTLFFNKMSQGILIGFMFPLIFFMLYYIVRGGTYNFTDYLKHLWESKKFVSVISLSVFPNLLPFLLLMNSNRYSSCEVPASQVGIKIVLDFCGLTFPRMR